MNWQRRAAAATAIAATVLAAAAIGVWRCLPVDGYPSDRRTWPTP